MRKTFIVAALSVMAVATSAQAETVKSGKLNCTISAGVGYFIASSKAVSCQYVKNNGRAETYSGRMTVFGADVGVTDTVHLSWGVRAPAGAKSGALAGRYSGFGANAAAGVGGGVHMLVGGSNGVSLQPLGGRVHGGVNVTAGIHSLNLKYDGPVYKGKAKKSKKASSKKHVTKKAAPKKAAK